MAKKSSNSNPSLNDVSGESTVSAKIAEAMGQTPTAKPMAAIPPEPDVEIGGFNLKAFRLPNGQNSAIAVKRKPTRVPVRKPPKGRFIRVRPGEEWQLQTVVLEIKDDNNPETYLLGPEMWDYIPELTKCVTLRLAVDKQGNVFIIAVPLPDEAGKWNAWHESLGKVAETAEKSWLRCVANMAAGGYDMYLAEGELAEPEWPQESFAELVKIAFDKRIIMSPDHPVIEQLKGLN